MSTMTPQELLKNKCQDLIDSINGSIESKALLLLDGNSEIAYFYCDKPNKAVMSYITEYFESYHWKCEFDVENNDDYFTITIQKMDNVK